MAPAVGFISSAIGTIFGIKSAATILAVIKVTTAVVSVASQVLLAYGLQLAGSLLRPKPKIPKAADGRTGIRQPAAPRASGYGRARMAGVYQLYEERAGSSYDVLAFHDGRVDAVERYFLHDDEVTVVNGIVQPTADGAYGGTRVRFRTTLGLATETAFAETVSAVGDIWTAQHRGDGVASIELVSGGVAQADFARIYPNGLPQPSVVARLQRVFDPRQGGQSYDDPATWAWSDNPILCLMHYLTDANAGMGEDYARRIAPALADWIAAANVCDEPIPLAAGGTEKRYRCGGWFLHDTDPVEVIDMLLTTCDGWLAPRGDGALTVRAGKFIEPTVVFTADHIVEFSTQRFVADEDALTELIVGYTTPTNYTDVEAPAWIDAAERDARGKDRVASVEATWVQSRPQARRLAKRTVLRANAKTRGSIRTTLFGLTALGHRYVRIQNPTLPSLADITAEVQRLEIDLASMTVLVEYVQLGAEIDAWNPATEEGAPEAAVTVPGAVKPPTPTGVIGNCINVVSGTDVFGIGFRIRLDRPARTDLTVSVQWGVRGTSFSEEATFALDQMDDVGGGKIETVFSRSSMIAGQFYVARVATVGPGGAYSEFVTVDMPAREPLPPPPPIQITATGGSGQAVLGWRTPPRATHAKTRVYRARAGETFSQATSVDVLGAQNTVQSLTQTLLAPGGYQYWFRTIDTSEVLSQQSSGPFDVTVT